MHCFYKRILTLTICIFTTFSAFSQLQLVPQNNAMQLAQKLVGEGVTITNAQVSGSALAKGFFYNRGGTQLGPAPTIKLKARKGQRPEVFVKMK